jgi:hypothetical protein
MLFQCSLSITTSSPIRPNLWSYTAYPCVQQNITLFGTTQTDYYILRVINDRPDLSSERAPHRDKKKQLSDRNLRTGNNVWSQAQSGPDTKTYWGHFKELNWIWLSVHCFLVMPVWSHVIIRTIAVTVTSICWTGHDWTRTEWTVAAPIVKVLRSSKKLTVTRNVCHNDPPSDLIIEVNSL